MMKTRITQADPLYCVTCNMDMASRKQCLAHKMHDHVVTSAHRGGVIRMMLQEMRDTAPRKAMPSMI